MIISLGIHEDQIPLEKIIEMIRKGEICEVIIKMRGQADQYNEHRYFLEAKIDNATFMERFWPQP